MSQPEIELGLPRADRRTYGTYRFGKAQGREAWQLLMEPAVAVRAKRVFGRSMASRAGEIVLIDTIENAREIQWFMERFPLAPHSPKTANYLAQQAQAHRIREHQVGQILAGQETVGRRPSHQPVLEVRDYQRIAVDLLHTMGSLLLTDAKGLGKTFQGLLAGSGVEDGLPMLVVCPVHLATRWTAEVEKAFPTMTAGIAKRTRVPDGWTPEDLPDVFVVPYSRMDGWSQHLAGNVRTVVYDEVQDLRHGVGTRKGRAAAYVSSQATYNLGLTASPIYNYAGEMWNLLDILSPDSLGTREEFFREWGGSMTASGGMVVRDPAALGGYLRQEGLMLGRTRKEVGRELPAHIPVPVDVETDEKVMEEMKGDALALAKLILSQASTTKERFTAAGQLDMEMRKITGVAKAPFVAAYVKMLLESEEKLILCGWHRDVYDVWNEQLSEYRPVMYTGSESPKQKDEAFREFVEGDARVLIMSLRSGSGLEGLQHATNVVVFGELDWSPQTHGQIIGRLERDGMGDDPVLAYYLNATEGSDPPMMETLGIKRNQAEPVVNPDGKLTTNAAPDRNRSRMLAEQLLRKV